RYVDGLTVNKKRVLRLMQTHSLTVKRNVRLKARRTPSRSKPRPSRPNEWWGIDMTKVMTRRSGWVHLVVAVDWR
ncbi:MAG: IS3 family transposase, partial [Nitrospinota bacterium]|nr:IS3 family transposase [Nitrospinota bacterium]